MKRLAHAVRYLLRNIQPPNPNEQAHNTYWLTLGQTGDMTAAAAARDAVLAGTPWRQTYARPDGLSDTELVDLAVRAQLPVLIEQQLNQAFGPAPQRPYLTLVGGTR